jgi:putative Holliday junction resolvase
VRVLALDYGSARTGVAISDPSGTIATPVGVVERASTSDGLAQLEAIVREQDVERVVVGLPLTPRGEVGEQARETLAFAEALGELLSVPVEFYDERFTTTLAAGAGGAAEEDARAAAFLLESYLRRAVGA